MVLLPMLSSSFLLFPSTILFPKPGIFLPIFLMIIFSRSTTPSFMPIVVGRLPIVVGRSIIKISAKPTCVLPKSFVPLLLLHLLLVFQNAFTPPPFRHCGQIIIVAGIEQSDRHRAIRIWIFVCSFFFSPHERANITERSGSGSLAAFASLGTHRDRQRHFDHALHWRFDHAWHC